MNKWKKFLLCASAVLVTVVMLLLIAPPGFINLAPSARAGKISAYRSGDTFTCGSYPQSKVTDSAVLNGIKGVENNYQWKSYNYYCNTGSESKENVVSVEKMMYYKDVKYNGSTFRAVKINSYRPYSTLRTSSSSNSQQYRNGYSEGKTYYFKFEPLTWRVLSPKEGLVICTKAIDSQAYQNFIYSGENGYYNGKDCKSYASDWASSSLRSWLNNDFYNTAFSGEEKALIVTSDNKNPSTSTSACDSQDTTDKVFLLSYSDALNSSYGYNSSYSAYDAGRQIKSTDYAQCQGCERETARNYAGNASWWLRSPNGQQDVLCASFHGEIQQGFGHYVCRTDTGVVPVLKFNPKATVRTLTAPVVTSGNVASTGKVKLTWDSIAGASSYKVYRSESKNGTYKLMKTTTSTSYINTSAKTGTTYYYKVTAVESDGTESAYSTVVMRTCDLARPAGVKSSLNSKGCPKITWSKVSGAESYKVYRSTAKNGTYKLMKTTTSTSYINTTAESGTTYYYKVKAVCSKSAAASAYSTTVSIKAK